LVSIAPICRPFAGNGMAVPFWPLAACWTMAVVVDAFVFPNRLVSRMADRLSLADILCQVIGAFDSCILRHFYHPELSSNPRKRNGETELLENSQCRGPRCL